MKWILQLTVLLSCVVVITPSWVHDLWKSFTGSEYCDDEHIPKNISLLMSRIENELFGQPFVTRQLIPMLNSHLYSEPKKPLVVVLFGWSGVGKNFLSNMIVESLYKFKSKSAFVHQFFGRFHFPRSSSEDILKYSTTLREWVVGNVSHCQNSIFIFDEIEKMEPGILERIKPLMDFHHSIDNVDFRKSIFFFLSNSGGNHIWKQYMDLWSAGKTREQMEYKNFEPVLRYALYSGKGVFGNSPIIEDHLISLYLPLLPLEITHIKQCIRAEMKRQSIRGDEEFVENIVNELEFIDDRFSASGCKTIHDKVAVMKYKHLEL